MISEGKAKEFKRQRKGRGLGRSESGKKEVENHIEDSGFSEK